MKNYFKTRALKAQKKKIDNFLYKNEYEINIAMSLLNVIIYLIE